LSACAKSVAEILSNGLLAFLDVSGEREGDAAAPWTTSRGHSSALQLSCWLPIGRFQYLALYQTGQMGLT